MSGSREKQKQETRKLLLEKARLLFASKGFRKTTIKQVAQDAGVAVGTVFVHFPDKSALLAASFYDGLDEIIEHTFETLPPDEEGIVVQLLHFAECFYRWYRRDVELSKHLLKETLFLTGEWGEKFRGQSELFIMRLTKLVEASKARQEISEDIDSFLVTIGFFSNYFTAVLAVVKEPETPVEFNLMMLERLLRWQLRLPEGPLHTCLPSK